jgi:glycerol-3-phosphate dehydrogenase
MTANPQHSTCIVIGSGMAGLATAQVASRWFERVMMLERDHPESNNGRTALDMAKEQQESRPGVSQVCCSLCITEMVTSAFFGSQSILAAVIVANARPCSCFAAAGSTSACHYNVQSQ